MLNQASFKLIFTMNLKESQYLQYGNLALIYPDGQKIDYQCTSGCAGFQGKNDQWVRARGPIPASNDYYIPTKPYYLPTKGIEGNFFHIQPDPIRNSKGVVRGEFGLHFDANVPGSAGCIVFKNRAGFRAFEERMAAIHKSGVATIPLIVEYS